VVRSKKANEKKKKKKKVSETNKVENTEKQDSTWLEVTWLEVNGTTSVYKMKNNKEITSVAKGAPQKADYEYEFE